MTRMAKQSDAARVEVVVAGAASEATKQIKPEDLTEAQRACIADYGIRTPEDYASRQSCIPVLLHAHGLA